MGKSVTQKEGEGGGINHSNNVYKSYREFGVCLYLHIFAYI